ncbi:SRPBCC domain-containing protein [Paenibacillus sp. IB182496]|uniref:SRPBCC domain-containing protein n=1 Tax=Paenibacillus sabuli TaxID=2772509 RepID=A0A927GSY6_9BACL|nr:SRPBCC domain-containing protein [Paenibacillus sabuli]MBD2846525.1 SRPBCC domain-containing protein [Paenibacillus sabuli]
MADIEHLQSIHAPAADVYKALTTAEGLAEVWTRELTVYQEVGSIHEFRFGGHDLTKMRIVTLKPMEKVEWTCTESDPEWVGTTISFELHERRGKTNILLRHRHWREITDFYRSCNYNWAMFLYSLKTYCETGRGLPYQDRTF